MDDIQEKHTNECFGEYKIYLTNLMVVDGLFTLNHLQINITLQLLFLAKDFYFVSDILVGKSKHGTEIMFAHTQVTQAIHVDETQT